MRLALERFKNEQFEPEERGPFRKVAFLASQADRFLFGCVVNESPADQRVIIATPPPSLSSLLVSFSRTVRSSACRTPVYLVQVGQAVAQETELAWTHAPGVGEQLTHQVAVADGVDALRDLQRVPADRAHHHRDAAGGCPPRARRGPAIVLALAAKSSTIGAVSASAGWSRGQQAFGGHRLAAKPVSSHEGGMEVCVPASGAGWTGSGCHARCEYWRARPTWPGHVRVERRRAGWLSWTVRGQAFLEEPRPLEARRLQHESGVSDRRRRSSPREWISRRGHHGAWRASAGGVLVEGVRVRVCTPITTIIRAVEGGMSVRSACRPRSVPARAYTSV